MRDGESAAVAVKLKLIDDYLMLHIFIKNLSEERFDIDPMKVQVKALYVEKEETLAVSDPNKILDDFEKEYKTAKAFYAIGAALQSAGAAYSYSTTTGNTYGSNGYTSANYRTQNYDPAKTAIVANIKSSEMREMNKDFAEGYSEIKAGLLLRHTLFPRREIEGIVKAEFKQAPRYLVEFPVGSEVFTFEFDSPVYEEYFEKRVKRILSDPRVDKEKAQEILKSYKSQKQ